DMAFVFVVDSKRQPLAPWRAARAQRPPTQGIAAVWRRQPCSIIRRACPGAVSPELVRCDAWLVGRPENSGVPHRRTGAGAGPQFARRQVRDASRPADDPLVHCRAVSRRVAAGYKASNSVAVGRSIVATATHNTYVDQKGGAARAPKLKLY